MNIPYADFYGAENAVDAITSATLKGKARNINVIGASYHQSEESVSTEGIAGAIYPVKASAKDLAALGGIEITDESVLSYVFSARGKDTKVNLTGADVLMESPNYSYYVLSEVPAAYKELSVENGTPVFSEVVGSAVSGEAAGKVSYTGHHADIEISLEGIEVDPASVSGVIVTTEDGTNYAMHHVVNIWRGELGWDLIDLDLGGQTIEVSVTIENDIILSIEITGFRDDEEYFSPSIEGAYMIEGILGKQSPYVDVVTGATESSEGLIRAVSAALNQARNP